MYNMVTLDNNKSLMTMAKNGNNQYDDDEEC